MWFQYKHLFWQLIGIKMFFISFDPVSGEPPSGHATVAPSSGPNIVNCVG